MISLADSLGLIYRYFMEKKGRAFLTISGIIIGIFTFCFFLFMSQGLSNAIEGQFSSFGLNVVGVTKVGNGVSNGPPGGFGMTDKDVNTVKKTVDNYKYVAPFTFYTGPYEYGREKQGFTSLGYKMEDWQDVSSDLGFELEQGRNLKSGDSGVIMIGAKAAEAFGENNKIGLGNSLKANGVSLRVVGILKERGDFMVDNAIIMSNKDISRIAEQDTYTGVRVSFYDEVDVNSMIEKLDMELNNRGKEKNYDFSTPSQAIDQFQSIVGVLTAIISFVSFIALLVGGINVLNTMHSNVIERTNEISTFKAIGATNKDIVKIYLMESAFFGFFGALIGFFLSFGLAKLISIGITQIGYNVPVFFEFGFFSTVVVVTTIATMVFGTYPAISASKVNPADNLRDE